MDIPSYVVDAINNYLGVDGKPHLVQGDYQLDNSSCLEWPILPETEGGPVNAKLLQLSKQHAELVQVGEVDKAQEIVEEINLVFKPYEHKATKKYGIMMYEPKDLLPENPHDGVNSTLFALRKLLQDEPVTLYRSNLEWTNVYVATAKTLVVAPTNNQFEILKIENTTANNQELDTDMLILRLQEIDLQYGVDIVGAGHDTLEFLLERVPAQKTDDFRILRRKLGKLCTEFRYLRLDLSPQRLALWFD